MGKVHKIKTLRKMVILNTYPVKAKLKSGIGTPLYLFRIPPKTNFRFETISPGITFAGVLDQAGATAFETSLAAARPQSSVVWNGPDQDMDVRVAMIQNVNGGGGGDSTKVYLQKPGGVWDDRYAVPTGQLTMLGANILTDYDYYFQCDFPHIILSSVVTSLVSGNWTPAKPRQITGGVSWSAAQFVQPVQSFTTYLLQFLGGGSGQYAGPPFTLQDIEFLDARFRLPPGTTLYTVSNSSFNQTTFDSIVAGNYLAVVAEIHDAGSGLNGTKCC